MSNEFITLLWQGLPHPPLSYLGEYKYREPDGSKNVDPLCIPYEHNCLLTAI